MTSTDDFDYSDFTPRPFLHTPFNGIPGLSYKFCCSINDLLAQHGGAYLRHVNIRLLRRDDVVPLPEWGALDHFHWDLERRVVEVVGDVGLAAQGKVHYLLLPSRYQPGETCLHVLLMLAQPAFIALGNEEQSSEQVLEELLEDSWALVQRESRLLPVWITSAIQGVGTVYLSDARPDQGASALSDMLAFCCANSGIRKPGQCYQPHWYVALDRRANRPKKKNRRQAAIRHDAGPLYERGSYWSPDCCWLSACWASLSRSGMGRCRCDAEPAVAESEAISCWVV